MRKGPMGSSGGWVSLYLAAALRTPLLEAILFKRV